MSGLSTSIGGLRKRAGSIKRPDIGKKDVTPAITSAIAAVPDGMASGVLAGVNPVYGLYTLIIGMPVTALAASTQIMIFNTTSAMTLVAADGLGDRTGEDRVKALFALALVCGVFQLAMGILGLGFLTRFVSNAVMTGFLTGIAVLIILGQLWDLTGFQGEGGSKLEQTSELITNLSQIDLPTTFIGIGALVLMFGLERTKLASFNLLIALGIALAGAWLMDKGGFESIALVSSLGDIPRSLPMPELPQLSVVPAMLLAGVATAIVGLLQAAGVAQQFPNKDGSEPDDSRDFLAQGAGNIASSVFQGMPGGGSLSGTSLYAAAGGRSRWGIVIQAPIVITLILVFNNLLSMIPMAALAALLVYSALLAINLKRVATVASATRASFISMLVTFLATLVIPLQQAVILGVVLAGILYIYRSSTDIRVMQLVRRDGGVAEIEAPDKLTSDSVTILEIYGSIFYAGARTLGQRLPTIGDAQHPVVILRLRGHGEMGSTFLNVINDYAKKIQANGGRLLLSGVESDARDRLAASGHLDVIGVDNVYTTDEIIGRSTEAAFKAGNALLAEAADQPVTPQPTRG
jgi:SulP family sulfate permease